MLAWLGFFVIASFVGFWLDKLLRSVRRRRYAPIRRVPLSPLYAIASAMLLCTPQVVAEAALPVRWLAFSLLFASFEYVSGALILRFMRRRIWDYRDRFMNLHGHVSLWHFFMWGGISVVLRPAFVMPLGRSLGLA